MGAVSGDISCRVCSTCGARATATGVHVAQEYDRVSVGDHQDVYREIHLFPRVCHFRTVIDVVILEYGLNGDLIVFYRLIHIGP